MQITLEKCGRRFNKEWIFRDLSFEFNAVDKIAVLGPNGSGKSTLLSVISGNMSLSEGNISYNNGRLKVEDLYQQVSFTAPYIDLIEEFTLLECLSFHFSFKKLMPGLSIDDLPELLGLEKAKNKAIKYFSSGMRQRTRLALACFENTPLLLLDEPTANLDLQGIEWYQKLIEDFGKNKLIVVASNQEHEYYFCHNFINILDHKPSIVV
ncbi:ABC transporter ATP-binding protein [Pedobacter flavus]|uniref:ATP-binding cassette domain-containing protein n=1 Tax=Pedobacter flavus TaxID=3113906 RepID=A0ABU7GZG8_9SPHI|nr:ATP-binding cassette domain-containing protein [Pedobacter sp. VNH31]MEE1884473.1 ATP-binding cassette domain-containing protein [Pedobacter sp. VNH31]